MKQQYYNNFIDLYNKLLSFYGNQNWWPGDSRDEIIIGAVLTQGTNWNNVEIAIQNLKQKKLLSLQSIIDTDISELEQMIKPSGFYTVKARRLKSVAETILSNKIEAMTLKESRNLLLNTYGVGEETADCILLYAFDKPVFVVDSYTERIFNRINIAGSELNQQNIRKVCNELLPGEIYNEYHALLVKHGKDFCKKKPLCNKCFLSDSCLHGI
ncbi:MAG: endonuclease [Candidatus Cloacimonetes bacterium]|nr:endonuclease [Candidatus Cloacimonadota bacterium]